MTSRRDFLQIAAAAAAVLPNGWSRAFAQQRLAQGDLLAFEPLGNVTLVHLTDIHAQLRPIFFREPSINLGVGEARGEPPHVGGRAFLERFGVAAGSAAAHALTPEDFTALAKAYGRMGGLDRIATVLKAVRAERGGIKVAVIGQACPYTPIANPRWLMPNWSFGIREEEVQANVDEARRDGAGLVVLLSHNGFDVDRKLASRVRGIDVILTAHTHDALPEAVAVGKTLLVASGSHGKFVSRLDLDVRGGEVRGYPYKLIPVFSGAIASEKTGMSL